MSNSLDDLIEELKTNDCDFYEQVAGDALDKLRKMYGPELREKDVLRVIEALSWFVSQMPEG